MSASASARGAPTGASARVWLAEQADAPTVARLVGEFRDWQRRDQPSDASILASVERLLADRDAEFLVGTPAVGGGAEAPSDERDRAAGVCQLRYRYGLWHAAEDCWLEDLYVREGARGAGLGRALVAAAIEGARRRGCRRIELDADGDNDAALALYGGFGFSARTASGASRLMLRLFLPAS